MQSRCYSNDGVNKNNSKNNDKGISPENSEKSGDGSLHGDFEPLPAFGSKQHWLVDKNAIVTGGSRGIGEAIAIRLAQAGVRCTVIGRDEGALKNVVKRLDYWYEQGQFGGPAPNVHSYVVGDVRDEAMWPNLYKDVCPLSLSNLMVYLSAHTTRKTLASLSMLLGCSTLACCPELIPRTCAA